MIFFRQIKIEQLTVKCIRANKGPVLHLLDIVAFFCIKSNSNVFMAVYNFVKFSDLDGLKAIPNS